MKDNQSSPKPSDLIFQFKYEGKTQLIEAKDLYTERQYIGKMPVDPLFDVIKIKNFLKLKQFEVYQNLNGLRLEMGVVVIDFAIKPKVRTNHLKRLIDIPIYNQQTFSSIIASQQKQLQEQKETIEVLRMTVLNLIEANQRVIELVQNLSNKFELAFGKISERRKHNLDGLNSMHNVREQPSLQMIEVNQKVKQTDNNTNIKKIDDNSGNLEQQISFSPFLSSPESFSWSSELKSDKLEIKNTTIIQNSKEQNQFHMALVGVGFGDDLVRKQCWAMKVNYTMGQIYLGVCLKNKIEMKTKNKHKFNQLRNLKGAYLICTNGLIYCSQRWNIKDNQIFAIQSQDVVVFQYDPIHWIMKFKKNQRQQTFQIPILSLPENCSYHPCVVISSHNGSVELLFPERSMKHDQKKLQVHQMDQERN